MSMHFDTCLHCVRVTVAQRASMGYDASMRVVGRLCMALTSSLLWLEACQVYRGELLPVALDAATLDAGRAEPPMPSTPVM